MLINTKHVFASFGRDWYRSEGYSFYLALIRRASPPEGEYAFRVNLSVQFIKRRPFVWFWACLIPAWSDEMSVQREWDRTRLALLNG